MRLFLLSLLIPFASCSTDHLSTPAKWERPPAPMARYWWFADDIQLSDVRQNLEWLRDQGFSGAEIAWVYPLPSYANREDTTYLPRDEWLGKSWQYKVAETVRYADSLGLICDMTLGTLWPFGDSHVPLDQASVRYGEDHPQEIILTWEHPRRGRVIDHLNPEAYHAYFNRLLDSFPASLPGFRQAGFIDSWEVETRELWTPGLEDEFESRYGYDLLPIIDSLYQSGYEHQLYDYRALISEKVIGFYRAFDSVLNRKGFLSRGQCSGAPADIISAYAQMDIPEGEAMLYEPEFSQIPASAAILSGKNLVSAESFTCLYGWPRQYIREEQTADLKLVADALFANGINRIIWHGKPHSIGQEDSINFYASVHLGPEGTLFQDLQPFNQYLTSVSSLMSEGHPYTDIAVYLPTEDAWINGEMPIEKQFIWAKDYYEMRYQVFPEELNGYHPTWINQEFLEKAVWDGEQLTVGEGAFQQLYVDVEWLNMMTMDRLLELAKEGLPITLKQIPSPAGTISNQEFQQKIDELLAQASVSKVFAPNLAPLLSGNQIPPFRARETEDGLILFVAQPESERLLFPIAYGQSLDSTLQTIDLLLTYEEQEYSLPLRFEPYQSLAIRLGNSGLEQIDVQYVPSTPTLRNEQIPTPWMVE